MNRWIPYVVDASWHDFRVDVYIERLRPLDDGDEQFKETKAWVRLAVVRESNQPTIFHVNIGSSVEDLLRANVQGFDDKTSLYVVDGKLELRRGDRPIEGPITLPPQFEQRIRTAESEWPIRATSPFGT